MPGTGEAIRKGIELGWHPGAQICVWHDGEIVINAGVGIATGTTPMTADSVNPWLSSGKPIGATAIMLLSQDGLLDIDEPVSRYWPEFGKHGKQPITSRHLLTHTAGIHTAESVAGIIDQEEVVAALENARLEFQWEPGMKAAYHPYNGWRFLGELVFKLSWTPFDEFVQARIVQPLGMDSASFSANSAASIARNSVMYSSNKGVLIPDDTHTLVSISNFTRPGGGLRSTASDMVRFYRMLLGFGEFNGVRLLEPGVVADMISPQRTGMKDHTFGQVMDWGLGVMLDNKIHSLAAPYGYGPHASGKTFGHGGRESSTAFADPDHDLAVAIVFNGMPGEPTHDRRLRMVTGALYEDLGLV